MSILWVCRRGRVTLSRLFVFLRRGSRGGGASSAQSAGSAQTGKKYRLRLLEKKDAFCLQDIGDGATFCLRVNCTTKHSGTQRVFLYDRDGLFVIGKSKDTAFSSPVLRQNQVAHEVWEEDWQDSTKPIDDWRRLFQAASLSSHASSKASLIVDTARVTQSQLFKTPGKKVKRSFEDSKLDDFSPYREALHSPAKLLQFKKSVSDKPLQAFVPSLDKGLSEVSEVVEILTNESRKLMLGFEDGLDKVALKVDSLADKLGSERDAGLSALVAPTLWGTVGTMSEALNGKLDASTDVALKSEVLQARMDLAQQVQTSEAGTESNIKAAKEMFLKIVSPILQRVVALEQATTQPGSGPFQQAQGLGGVASGGGSNSQPAQISDPALTHRVGILENRADDGDIAMAELEAKIDDVKAEREESAIKFAGIGASSIEELGPWIDKNFSERAFGLIMDPYLLLHLIVGKDTNQKSLLDAMKRRKDLNIHTEADAKALAALLHEVPEMMHSCTADDVGASDQASYLSHLKSHDQWGTGARCMKKTIEKRLVQIKTSVSQRIRKEFSYGSIAYGVAIEALEKSVTWVGNLISFMDRTFESVYLDSKYSKRQAWALTTQLVRRVWNDLYAVRLGALDNMEGDQHSMCKAVLWAVFRTHDLMEAFDVANFDDHPSISSEYVKFLATNSGFEMMESVQKEMAGLLKQNKELKDAVEKHKRAAEQATSTAGDAKSALAEVLKRLTVVERKVK